MKAWCLLLLVGCRSAAPGPYSPTDQAARNTVRAQELSRQAADLLDSDPQAAERLLRDALGADLFYGPAHNNLGVLFLKEGKLYEAAGEFEWARKLMPGHPDPRMNLALTLEQAGQVDEAIKAYQTALEVYPGHIPTLQALAKLHCVPRVGGDNEFMDPVRPDLQLTFGNGGGLRGGEAKDGSCRARPKTAAWREWARRRLVQLRP